MGEHEGEERRLGPELFPLLVLFEAGLAPVALASGWAVGEHPLAGFAWDPRAAGAGVVAALPMIAMMAASVRWPVGPLRAVKAFFDRELAPALETCGWPDLALIAAAAGVGEEMLFRGVLQAALARALGEAGGLAASAVLFGLLHPVSVAYAVLAGLLGAYLGAVWLVTGNLLAPIVAHAVYDFAALAVLLRDRARRGAA